MKKVIIVLVMGLILMGCFTAEIIRDRMLMNKYPECAQCTSQGE